MNKKQIFYYHNLLMYVYYLLNSKLIDKSYKHYDLINCIKHSNFDKIVMLGYNYKINDMVIYNKGEINNNPDFNQTKYGNFLSMMMNSNNFKIIYNELYNEFGKIKKSNLYNKNLYYYAADFELQIRNIANRLNLYNFTDEYETLENIINNINSELNLSCNYLEELHNSRKILNSIKYNKIKNNKDINDGIRIFKKCIIIIDTIYNNINHKGI